MFEHHMATDSFHFVLTSALRSLNKFTFHYRKYWSLHHLVIPSNQIKHACEYIYIIVLFTLAVTTSCLVITYKLQIYYKKIFINISSNLRRLATYSAA